MARNVRRRRFVATAIAVLFAAMPAAICLAGAASTRAEQEPCATMADGGGGSSLQQHCCAVDAPNSSAILSLALPFVTASPSCFEANVFDIVFNDRPVGLRSLDSIAPDPPRSPTYLLLSVFRI
jgi:hypothetical protein